MPDFATVYAQLYDAAYQVTLHAARAVVAFLQRESFLYWPFLISTVVIAMLAWRFGYASGVGGPATWREFFRRFFGGTLWWHSSARADYRVYLVNAVVFPLLIGPLLFGDNIVAELVD